MAQSNEQEGDELRNKLRNYNANWMIHGFPGLTIRMLPERCIDDFMRLILADRKHHELELLNRLEEQGRPGVSSDGQKTLVINVSAIEAERERLGK